MAERQGENIPASLHARYPLERLFGRVITPLERFVRRTSAGGIVLVFATLLALVAANSEAGDVLEHFWHRKAGIYLGPDWSIELSVHGWVNEGLMVLFFLVVGLELKREFLVGELATLHEAALPAIAAVGGMAVPALVYLAFNHGLPSAVGWAIPAATDIAFAVGILVLLAERIPRNLIVFLMALAIADDLGAVIVIAAFYTGELNRQALLLAALIVLGLALLNRGGIRRPLPYWLLGSGLWYFVLLSGIHATIAGIVLAFAIPVRPAYSPRQFDARVRQLLSAFRAHAEDPTTPSDVLTSHDMATIAGSLEQASQAVQSPLQRTEIGLGPWVTFGVLPIFAFANAGIDFGQTDFAASLNQPVTLGVAFGLVFGKFAGVSLFSWLAVRFGATALPAGVGWRHLLGAAWLAGIGFTMSLFISQLAFTDAGHLAQAKLGILLASCSAALIGLAWLAAATRWPARRDVAADSSSTG